MDIISSILLTLVALYCCLVSYLIVGVWLGSFFRYVYVDIEDSLRIEFHSGQYNNIRNTVTDLEFS